jgi:hypothetical protein
VILTGDWHLDDNPANASRWLVFDALENAMASYGDRHILILGDLGDRKDRHPGALVNRLVQEFQKQVRLGAQFDIIMGNHDKPLNGPAYWTFLNEHPGVRFYDKPTWKSNILLLPYSSDPAAEWPTFLDGGPDVIFMHQTVTGVRENGQLLKNDKMPDLPDDIPIYSGDIHTPQRVGPVTYVGAPHHCRFGDTHSCRMLIIDDKTYRARGQIDLFPPRKVIAEISSIKELEALGLQAGDQVRIRWKLPVSKMDQWELDEEAVQEWQHDNGVIIDSLEPTITMDAVNSELKSLSEEPAEILRAYAEAEGIEGPLLDYGLELLEKGKGL